jgi:RNA polymerase sigma factor (TIGR02999 family)
LARLPSSSGAAPGQFIELLMEAQQPAEDCDGPEGPEYPAVVSPDSRAELHPQLVVDEESLAELYQELRQMAAARMAKEKPQTLQATALVHEAWLKLGGRKFENRAHFFGAAAEAMRRILVERARRRGRLKRGGEQERVDYEESRIVAPVDDDKLLQVNEVLEKLATLDPLKARIVKLRFFTGLENAEIGALLEVNEKTVRRHWQVAKVMLYQLIKES